MRMWKVKPELLCDKHLLGEHVEMHMFVGCLNKGQSIKGYLDKGLVEVHGIVKRHNLLVKEMTSRGFNHQSPLSFKGYSAGQVSISNNLKELTKRCNRCRERITSY